MENSSMTMVNMADTGKNEPEVLSPQTQRYGCLPVNRVQGADFSQWNAKTTDPRISIDFDKVWRQGARFCFIRVSCKGTNDAEFTRSWAGAKKAGLLRGAYIAIDYKANIQSQVQKSIYRLNADPGELPVAVDFEKVLYTGLGPTKALDRLKIAMDSLDATFG